MPPLTTPQTDMTAEELASRVGAIPLWRIRQVPTPGTAVEEDIDRIRAEKGTLCELIDGVLVEKPVSGKTSILAVLISTLLTNFILPRKLGWIQGPDGFVWLTATQLRAPDVSFIHRDQMPGGKFHDYGFATVAPRLAVEIFSPGNTAREMDQKRREFFAAGTELFWIVYPDRQQIEVFTDLGTPRTLTREDTLDGGTVLPGFSVQVGEIFAAAELE